MSVSSKLSLISSKLFDGASFSSLSKYQQEYVLQIYLVEIYTG